MAQRRALLTLDFAVACSVTLSGFFDDEATTATDELLDQLNSDERATIAAHWALEVGNTLLMAERCKRSIIADVPTGP